MIRTASRTPSNIANSTNSRFLTIGWSRRNSTFSLLRGSGSRSVLRNVDHERFGQKLSTNTKPFGTYRRQMSYNAAQLGSFRIPQIENEPMRSYAPGSAERKRLDDAIAKMKKDLPFDVPCVINGQEIRSNQCGKQPMPSSHANHLCTYHKADTNVVKGAIRDAVAAQAEWEAMPWNDRAAIFLKAADLISGKYREQILAATILGQGKNTWQAEIDAAAELCDFLRFGVKYVEELYAQQPPKNSAGTWNRVEYRPLEGFTLAISPFNFTAIGGNLAAAPALVGNVVIWKPSPAATYSNYLVHKVLLEAGLPPSVIQFVPGDPEVVVKEALDSRDFASLHFTGSTSVFRQLWKQIGDGVGEGRYRNYPRIVGETGGKNFHLVHKSADVTNAVQQSVRSGFEYQGQKCSALSRIYVSASVWPEFQEKFLKEVASIKVGPSEQWENFMGPVIGKPGFDKIVGYIEKAKQEGGEILCGGSADDSKGFFVQPTVILTKDPKSITMREEIFGPVVTVYVYQDEDLDKTLDLINSTTDYALTGAIFAQDRAALIKTSNALRNAAGNMYYNEKCTGAVVGQQPFGGSRGSGTNDKAGSISLFWRFVSARSIKEGFVGLDNFGYPSNLV
ncbi:1-pyrroline-5-carboxylate dehydrogenase [Serendipita sp. 396]|nr:1-pyrroline-5-carboxylate dehydrogenase [Serendipita sp. 396]KAG8789493.1 1-pyrroline-5-carboxylate dehydrogenase [Serendipita sp. 397]KAG8879079.1 1-pyrroline-5-carboxylate dehydrogenase [Serendipita sp. 405]